MSLTLITGLPGAGKSASMVKMLAEWHSKGRRIFANGVRDLLIPHEVLEDEDVANWHKVVPDGALVVIDEVQRHWRPRGSTAKVPPCIEELETHRHRGIDFILVTQHPGLLDANVRKLAGPHVHLVDTGLTGRWWYEWPKVGNVEQAMGAPVKQPFKLPAEVFDKYKSASQHVKTPRRIPTGLKVLAGVVVVAVPLVAYVVHRLTGRLSPSAPSSASSPAAPASSPRQAPPQAPAPYITRNAVQPPVHDREPYAGFGVHLAGGFNDGKRSRWWFALSKDGKPLAILRDTDVYAAGYAWRAIGPCVGLLLFGGRERLVACDAPSTAPQVRGFQTAASAAGAM